MPANCGDGNVCNTDSCDPATGCTGTVRDPSYKEPKSVSFYRRVCRKEQKGEQMADGNADCVNDSATFAPVDSIDGMCERLHPDPAGDKCEQAEAQFMATLLNRCKARITDDQPLDSRCSDHTVVGESIAESDAILARADRGRPFREDRRDERSELRGSAFGRRRRLRVRGDRGTMAGGGQLDRRPLPPVPPKGIVVHTRPRS